mmetsp:Transcript_5854/g.9995  ORF Transcript_5854/g.9995 Transcript_5854/m.9995 type:complete len:170 (+) Transcript_5854:549-1058(+)
MEPSVSFSVMPTNASTCEPLKLTPKKLFSEIRGLAEKRYQYSILPKKLHQIKSLNKPVDKMAVLRDICLAVGITINFGKSQAQGAEEKEVILENEGKLMRELISKLVLRQRSQTTQKKKKGGQAPQQTLLEDEEIFKYELLPFQASDIFDFFPILKTIPFQNKDVTALI